MGGFALGQSVTLSVGSGVGMAGSSASLPITLAAAGGAQVAGLQFSLSNSSDITNVTFAIGSAATNAQKSITCNGSTCLIYGFTADVISNGPVATATFQVASSPSSSTIPVQLTGVVAASSAGTSIPTTAVAGSISLVVPPVLSGINCAAGSITTPGSIQCTVSLSSVALAGGFPVPLSSNNGNLAIPASVTVAAGQSSVAFTVGSVQVSVDQTAILTAGSGGPAKSVTLTLVAPLLLTGFTCSPASISVNSSSTCTAALSKAAAGAVTISVSSNSALVTVPSSIAVPSGQAGASFQAVSANVTGSQSAVLTASYSGASFSATVVVTAPVPTADSVAPSGAAGLHQTFSFVFSDSQSAANFSGAAILFAPSLSGANSCFLVYDRSRATIQLEWDNLSGATAKAINSPAQLENSQCTVGAASVTSSALSNTITVDITFKSPFAGMKNIYLYGADTDGTINTGWVQRGTYSVSFAGAPPVPSADSVSPSSGSGLGQTFSFTFSDSQNAANLSGAAILIAPSFVATNSCYLVYDRNRNTIQLEWDNMSGASAKPIGSGVQLENSQCTIGAASVASTALTNTITVAITFKNAFNGLKNIYLYGADNDGSINTGWVQKGTYTVNTVAAPVPTADSVTPSGGAGPHQTFSFVFSDSQSSANLSGAAMLFSSTLTGPNSCFLVYDRNRGTIQLEWDNMSGATAKLINSLAQLENSQCQIGATSVTTTALSTTITVDIIFKTAFSSLKNIYLYGADTDGTINTGWVQRGTWTPF